MRKFSSELNNSAIESVSDGANVNIYLTFNLQHVLGLPIGIGIQRHLHRGRQLARVQPLLEVAEILGAGQELAAQFLDFLGVPILRTLRSAGRVAGLALDEHARLSPQAKHT